MNDIQQLIDRYLAEGLSAEELDSLSRAVHRDDAPAEWIIIRDMIDTLSEGEDDYDLILAARGDAAQPVANGKTAFPLLHSSLFRNIAAAAVILVAIAGTTLYFTNNHDPQIAQVEEVCLIPTDSPAHPLIASIDKMPETPATAEPSVSTAEPTVSAPVTATTTAEVPASRVVPEHRSKQHRDMVAVQEIAEAPHQDEMQPADTPEEVLERRIYSYNLLDQVSDY